MKKVHLLEKITDRFIENLADKYGEGGFESDVFYANGSSFSEGIVAQLWLEWFCGTIYISKDLQAEFSTLVLPHGRINDDNKGIIQTCLENFNKTYKKVNFELAAYDSEVTNAYLDMAGIDLSTDINASVEALVCHLDTISSIAKICYESIVATCAASNAAL